MRIWCTKLFHMKFNVKLEFVRVDLGMHERLCVCVGVSLKLI